MTKYPLVVNLSSYFLPYQLIERKGEITPCLEVVVDCGNLVLNSKKVNYSFGSLHQIYFRTFKKLNIQDRKIKNVLILGFGAGSIATLLTETFHKNCTISGIEADEVVIELAEQYFDSARFDNLTIHHTDDYDFVLACNEKFNLIAIDLFVEDKTPSKFSDHEFLAAIENLFAPSGIICCNRMVSDKQSRQQAEDLLESFDQIIGPSIILPYQILNTKNWMIVHDRASLIITPDFKKTTSNQWLNYLWKTS